MIGTSLSQLRSSTKAKYVLAVVVVIGILAIIPLSVQLSQESREDRSSASGQEGTGVISGTIYDDKNYNGVMDSGDPGLQKFTSIGFPIVIELVQTGGTLATPKITEAYADESGHYQFQELTFDPEILYLVRVKPQTGGQLQYASSSSESIKVKGPGTVNFGFGSLTAIQTDVPIDTCVMSVIPPDPNAATTANMRVFVRTNPDLSYTSRVGDNYEYETQLLAFGDKYGQFLPSYSLMRMQPSFPGYRQMVLDSFVTADRLLRDPSAPAGQAPDEFNLRRNGRLDCGFTLKKGGTVLWTHSNSTNFDVMEARSREFYWNGATPTPATACSVDINTNPSNIASNPPQSATISWKSANVYGNCEASGRWTGTMAPKGSMSSSPPGQSMNDGSYTYNIICKNADNVSCSDSAVLTVGNSTVVTNGPTPFSTVIPTPYINSVASGSAVIALSPSSGTQIIGQSVTVKIYVDSGSTPINTVQTSISYPAARADVTSINYAGTNFGVKAQENVGSGVITIARGSQTPVSGMAIIGEITFRVKSGPLPLTLSNGVAISSSTNQNLSVTHQNAIFAAVTPTFTPTYTPIPTRTIIVDPISPSITPQSILSGDLNNDGLVNLNDLSILLSNFGTPNTTADINGDGKVNIFDLSLLLSNMRQ